MRKLLDGVPLWLQGIGLVVLLAPLFFISYGAANQHAASLPVVKSIRADWEPDIPFLPWTIVPYWSIDLMYGLSLLVAPSALVLWRHAGRLLLAQAICISAFFLWPLRFSMERPPSEGWTHALFQSLESFDQPFNQAPSLHIVLLVVLWDFFQRRLTGALRWGLHAWCMLIAASVLTTYQHHVFDVPTGLLVGVFCAWFIPLDGPLPIKLRRHDMTSSTWAVGYGGAGLLLIWLSLALGAFWGALSWALWWPATALLIVALGYGWAGPSVFQKGVNGSQAWAARWLLAPHRMLARFNAWSWTGQHPAHVHLHANVWLGKAPVGAARGQTDFQAIVDLTAELLTDPFPHVHAVPMLDMVTPSLSQLRGAADALERTRQRHTGPVLVCCALGYTRSAAVATTWLVRHRHARNVDVALAHLKRLARPVVLSRRLISVIELACGDAWQLSGLQVKHETKASCHE